MFVWILEGWRSDCITWKFFSCIPNSEGRESTEISTEYIQSQVDVLLLWFDIHVLVFPEVTFFIKLLLYSQIIFMICKNSLGNQYQREDTTYKSYFKQKNEILYT